MFLAGFSLPDHFLDEKENQHTLSIDSGCSYVLDFSWSDAFGLEVFHGVLFFALSFHSPLDTVWSACGPSNRPLRFWLLDALCW